MFGRRKNKDVDWQSSLGQPMQQGTPPPAAEPAAPGTPTPAAADVGDLAKIAGLTPGQAKMVQITTRLAGQPNVKPVATPGSICE
jgi:hypothetical protein